MAKLFALEEMDESGVEMEMEASPEVGEIADVQVDMGEDMGGVEDQAEAISEGVAAADQLGEVEDVVASAAEGEGLDPVAAEAIRIAVEAICSRIGANPKAIYSLYATENFQSASSRKANSKIALEGVGEFLKDLWKKIKGALTSLWAKVKAFWDKHLSNLGRVKKALDSAKERIAASSGKLEGKAYIEEAPSMLVEAFAGTGDISVTSIGKFVTTHAGLAAKVEEVQKFVEKTNVAAADFGKLKDALAKLGKSEVEFGSAKEPLVGGVFVKYTGEFDAAEGTATFSVEKETAEDKETKRGLSVSDKAGLTALIKSTSDVVAGTIKYKAAFEKYQTAVGKSMTDMEKAINAVAVASDDVKNARKAMSIVYKVNAKAPGMFADVAGYNVKLAKAVLGFVAFSLKQYK